MDAVHFSDPKIEPKFREFGLTTFKTSFIHKENERAAPAMAAIALSRFRAWNLTRMLRNGRSVLAIESDVEALRSWVAADDIDAYDIVYVVTASLDLSAPVVNSVL
jgi:hypothetical protein